ncbi:MAG: hypothetical protein RIS35_1883 [Pseudomonadota bacterium]|jgi:hypothetical protein
MATAEVVITARDRTASAIASAQQGLRSLERTSKSLAKSVNLALGVLAGTSIKRAMEGIVRATADSAAGQRGFAQALNEVKAASTNLMAAKTGLPGATAAMKDLAAVLRDPGLVTAADALTSTLITGLARVAENAGKAVAGLRQVGLAMGIGDPRTRQETIDALSRDVDKKRQEIALAQNQIDFSGKNSPIATQARQNIPILQAEIAALERRMELLQSYDPNQSGGPRGRFANGRPGLGSGVNAAVAERAEAGGRGGSAVTRAVDQIAEVTVRSTEKATSAIDELYRSWDEATRTTAQRQIAEFEAMSAKVDELLRAGRITPEDARQRILAGLDEVLPEVETTAKRVSQTYDTMSEYAQQAARNMQDAFAQFLFDPFQGGVRGMLRSFIDSIRQMLAQAAAARIFDALKGMGSGKGGIIGSVVGAIFGRASGGPVNAGQPYIVGEKGPELFVPGSSGGIVPNHAMGGVTVAPVYNIDARGATADLQQALPGILAENNRRIFDELDRRYGIGR